MIDGNRRAPVQTHRGSIVRILFWANVRAAIWSPFRAIRGLFRPVYPCCGARRDGGHKFGCPEHGAKQLRFSTEFKEFKRGDRWPNGK